MAGTRAKARKVLGGLKRRVASESQVTARLGRLEKKVGRLEADLKKSRAEAEAARAAPAPSDALPPRVEQAVTGVMDAHLSYLGHAALRSLAAAVVALERDGVDGVLVEAGTALGGSAIVMATAKSVYRPLMVYDVFGMIPPPGEADGDDVHRRYETIVAGQSTGLGGDVYYGYRTSLYDDVLESFTRFGVPAEQNRVELIAGLFADTINLDRPVALAHLDGDWYESTMTCLTRIAPLLAPGGRFVVDDYDLWSGCRTAVDEYFADRPGFRFERHGKLHIVRE